MERWIRAKYQPYLPMGKNGTRVTASQEHIDISKEAAKEGMVLLKNEAGMLPLARGSKIALFGKGTFDYVKGGGGSGDVTVPYIRNLHEGFEVLGDQVCVFDETSAFYKEEVEKSYKAGKVPGMVKEPELCPELLKRAKAAADIAVISISRFSGENWDRKSDMDPIEKHLDVDQPLIDMANELFERGDFYLSEAETKMVEQVCDTFDKVVVVLNVGGMIDTSWFAKNDKIAAVLMAWQGGMEGGLAEAELLCGLGNPSGKLSDTFAARLENYPSEREFYESDDYVEYLEDIYVGYRYFETIPGAAEKVVYPFGYGLSYTEFEITDKCVQVGADKITVKASVENVGKMAGKEVLQVYFSAPQGKLGKPAKELAAFAKTRLLQPGDKQIVKMEFPIDQMASYDDLGKVQKSAYVLEAGTYRFFLGTSVRDVEELCGTLEMAETKVVCQLTEQMKPSQLTKRMLADGSFEEMPQCEAPNTNENIFTPMTREEIQFPTPKVRAVGQYQFMRVLEQNPPRYFDEVAAGTLSMEDFMAQLSAEDLAWMVGGQPNTGYANTFGYGNNVIYGVPNIMTADGPAGLRFWPETKVVTTAFPCSTLLACTWNPQITEQVGTAGGEEVKENNVGVWLTPAMNIHRNPLCGRNFEYYSEDPYLTGKLAAGMVKGIQSNRIAATVKHFALNNKETNRKESDSRASERAIREIYLRAFKIVVEEADPWCLMTSYNTINGHRACENKDMLTNILKGEWGYKGMVTSDWWTMGENYKEVLAGNDVKMAAGYPERILAAMEAGALTRADLEKCVRRVLEMILKID